MTNGELVVAGLTRIAGTCDDEELCPTVYVTDRGTIVGQGYLFAGVTPPTGEAFVEIPLAVLLEAASVAH